MVSFIVIKRETMLLVVFTLILFFPGCIRGPLVEVAVIDERTALENQILGSYRELDKEVLLLASVRAIDKTGKLIKSPPVPPGKKAVIHAVQRSSFNRDDIELYKRDGVIGENRKGFVSIIEPESIPKERVKFVENLVKEENTDRGVIMKRLIDINENLSEEDMPGIQKIFASLNRDRALKGDMIQNPEGEWVQKR